MEVQSLSLRPEGWVALDGSVVRLFVEYSLLDLPTEVTPLSLPKPPPGKSINYNYSKGETLPPPPPPSPTTSSAALNTCDSIKSSSLPSLVVRALFLL